MFKKAKWKKIVKKVKTTRRKLRDQLDKLWSVIIKLQAGGKCEKSGEMGHLNSHHIFSRSNLSVRWYLGNGVCLTAGWHILKKESIHQSPIEFIEWLKQERGVEWYNNLRLKANTVKKWTIPEMEEKVKEFQEEIKKFQE